MADNRQKSLTVAYIIIFVLGLVIIGLLLYIVPYRYRLNYVETYSESDVELQNPLTGYAPPASNEEECAGSQLVYIELRWADWEPQDGVYDIESLETRYHIARWKEEGKNAVLRFVCDIPGKTEHMDIPAWLYTVTADGQYYDASFGKGYCPNYENEFFRQKHKAAIQALASYCNQDNFVAYVELGSLGHWGEWHTDTGAGALLMPDRDICTEYVLDYSDSFYNARLLMRRNYQIAVEGGLGLYNDMAGQTEATDEWLSWLRDGGSYETSGESLTLVPRENFWENTPVGGELTSEYSMEELLSKRMNDTLEDVELSHMTFIGPNCPSGELRDSSGAKTIRQRLGYRIYISQLETKYSFADDRLNVYLTWSNTGLAPLYWDWPATMYVYNKDGKLEYWETIDMNLSELVPGKKIVTESHIPFTDLFRQGFQIGIGITSSDQRQHVQLAMDGEQKENVQVIYTFTD